MVFVPTTPYVPGPQMSLEAQELAREIECLIANYQEEHPRVTQVDVQRALEVALGRNGSGVTASISGRRVAVMIGLLLLGLFLAVILILQ